MVTALSASAVGGLVERVGPVWGLRSVCVGTCVVLIASASWATNLQGLMVILACGRMVNAVAPPSANLVLVMRLERREGLVFGVKQAAIPFATLLAGAALSLSAQRVGWRSTLLAGSAASALALVAVPSSIESQQAARRRSTGLLLPWKSLPARPLVWLAAAACLGTAASTAMGAFLVEYALSEGLNPQRSGALLVMGSSLGVAARVLVGNYADRGPVRTLPLDCLYADLRLRRASHTRGGRFGVPRSRHRSRVCIRLGLDWATHAGSSTDESRRSGSSNRGRHYRRGCRCCRGTDPLWIGFKRAVVSVYVADHGWVRVCWGLA